MVRGVCNKPDSFASVGRTDGASWNTKRLDVVSKGFHVSVHALENHTFALTNDSANVFTDNPCRLRLAYNS